MIHTTRYETGLTHRGDLWCVTYRFMSRCLLSPSATSIAMNAPN
jgi:hypothetical protein